MAVKKPTTRCANWPIPDEAMQAFRERKKQKGITIKRSIQDALSFALRPEFRQLWF